MNKTVNIITLIFCLLTAGNVFSQSKQVGEITESRNISQTGQTNSQMNFGNESSEIKELVRLITDAKKSGDAEKVKFYQSKLDALTGASKINCDNLQYTQSFNGETDVLNYNTVTGGIIGAASVAVDRITGDIYAVVADYFIPLKISIYKSVNKGLNFNLFFTFSPSSLSNYYPEANQIDLEVVSRGDSSYLYGVLGLWSGDSSKGMYFKIRNDADLFSSAVFTTTKRIGSGQGNGSVSPRITSDNAAFTQVPYIYIMYTLDSLRGTGNKWMKSKVLRIINPFAPVPALSQINPPGSLNNAYFYNAPNQPDSSYMKTDICCVYTGDSSFVVTTTVMRGATTFFGTNFYMTTATSFGSIISSSYSVNDTKLLDFPRIASPGNFTRNVMMGAMRLYGGGDWDPYYYRSNNINRNYGGFNTSGYVDNSADTITGYDLTARYGSYDTYLFAINNKKTLSGSGQLDGKILGNLYKGGMLTGLYQANPPSFPVQYAYNFPSASFRFVNNDSCFIGYGGVFSSGSGFRDYGVTGGCSGTFIGIENNSLMVKGFELNQNYPNPFNPVTKISYSVLKNSFVNIKIFDVMGREVNELVNSFVNAGEHIIVFNAEDLCSGIYYYKMESNNFSETKKMILVK